MMNYIVQLTVRESFQFEHSNNSHLRGVKAVASTDDSSWMIYML